MRSTGAAASRRRTRRPKPRYAFIPCLRRSTTMSCTSTPVARSPLICCSMNTPAYGVSEDGYMLVMARTRMGIDLCEQSVVNLFVLVHDMLGVAHGTYFFQRRLS